VILEDWLLAQSPGKIDVSVEQRHSRNLQRVMFDNRGRDGWQNVLARASSDFPNLLAAIESPTDAVLICRAVGRCCLCP
jgi:hypothetical protein